MAPRTRTDARSAREGIERASSMRKLVNDEKRAPMELLVAIMNLAKENSPAEAADLAGALQDYVMIGGSVDALAMAQCILFLCDTGAGREPTLGPLAARPFPCAYCSRTSLYPAYYMACRFGCGFSRRVCVKCADQIKAEARGLPMIGEIPEAIEAVIPGTWLAGMQQHENFEHGVPIPKPYEEPPIERVEEGQ